MMTVQLAIHNHEYALALRNLLLRDGVYDVRMVNTPDLQLGGIVVLDSGRLGDLSLLGECAERLIVIARKGVDSLSNLWEAGVRHVVLEEDAPSTARLAVIATEHRMAQLEVRYSPAMFSREKRLRRRPANRSLFVVPPDRSVR